MIVLIILAGIKPLEQRVISAIQQRDIQLIAERGSVSLDSIYKAPGAGTVRVKQFVRRPSDDPLEHDEALITPSFATEVHYAAIRTCLESIKGVMEFQRSK